MFKKKEISIQICKLGNALNANEACSWMLIKRKCLLVMLILMLVILTLILMLPNLNTGYADTDADLCIRIMSLCCIECALSFVDLTQPTTVLLIGRFQPAIVRGSPDVNYCIALCWIDLHWNAIFQTSNHYMVIKIPRCINSVPLHTFEHGRNRKVNLPNVFALYIYSHSKIIVLQYVT